MPDRDKDALAARNKNTLLVARVPAGLKPRVQEAAKQAGESVSTLVTTAVEKELRERDGGITLPAEPGEAVSPLVPAVTFQQPKRHTPNCKCLMCKPEGGKR